MIGVFSEREGEEWKGDEKKGNFSFICTVLFILFKNVKQNIQIISI